MLTKYLITVKGKCKILAGYHKDILHYVSVDIETSMDQVQADWLWDFVPRNVTTLSKWSKNKDVKYKKVAEDLSFQKFWNEYAWKRGNKGRAERLWNALSEVDKAAAMASLSGYKFWLSSTGTTQIFAEGYLSQRRFENQYS